MIAVRVPFGMNRELNALGLFRIKETIERLNTVNK